MASNLARERCVPCEGGMQPLTHAQAEDLLPAIADRWRLAADARSLHREIRFKNFARAIAFLNRLADVAEQEGHHPDFCLTGWNTVRLTLTTHAIGGLSRNDFILAAKLDQVVKAPAEA